MITVYHKIFNKYIIKIYYGRLALPISGFSLSFQAPSVIILTLLAYARLTEIVSINCFIQWHNFYQKLRLLQYYEHYQLLFDSQEYAKFYEQYLYENQFHQLMPAPY